MSLISVVHERSQEGLGPYVKRQLLPGDEVSIACEAVVVEAGVATLGSPRYCGVPPPQLELPRRPPPVKGDLRGDERGCCEGLDNDDDNTEAGGAELNVSGSGAQLLDGIEDTGGVHILEAASCEAAASEAAAAAAAAWCWVESIEWAE